MAVYVFAVLEYRGPVGQQVGYYAARRFSYPGKPATKAEAFRRVSERFRTQHPDLMIQGVYTLEEALTSTHDPVRLVALAYVEARDAEAARPKGGRGFANMDPERRREIARKGGASIPAEKRTFAKNAALARSAGMKGGEANARRVKKLQRKRG